MWFIASVPGFVFIAELRFLSKSVCKIATDKFEDY